LKGFRGGGVLEVVEDFDGNAYRTMYTVRFADEMDVVRSRLRLAQESHRKEGK